MVQNQAQGPTVQNPALGPANQNQGQVPTGQVPAQGLIQVVQNVPVQPLQQTVPMQLAPAGIVMPTPQIFYKLDRERNQNFQVSQKRMQNPIFSVVEIGWKHIISQKEKR